jgi:hypothetical protein
VWSGEIVLDTRLGLGQKMKREEGEKHPDPIADILIRQHETCDEPKMRKKACTVQHEEVPKKWV